jgi:EAL domain-containing protein (putative c-di-GMP-specific phosphodiesterase class I)/FixJ family two-component response regulator
MTTPWDTRFRAFSHTPLVGLTPRIGGHSSTAPARIPMDFGLLRTMVVEDQAVPRRIAVEILRELGVADILQAEDGQDALEQIRRARAPLDVIICDLDMPRMDGVEFIRNVAEANLGASIVLASALEPPVLASVEAMARSQGMAVLGVLEKPVTPQKLGDMLARHGSAKASYERFDIPQQVDPAELEEAIRDRRIAPHFQPMVRMSDGKIVGFEALARWRHAERGMLQPEVFIPIAESSGLIDSLTWVMLESAVAEAVRWRQAGHRWTISVNLSLPYLERQGIADRIAGLVERHSLQPGSVVLEVTESLAATQIAQVLGNIARLRMKGFGIAIDDYGTGYATLQQLSQMPFTELKIDRSFVSGSPHRPNLHAILRSSVELARQLNLGSVAEGIETPDEWHQLDSVGCDFAQGYLVAAPMPPESLLGWAEAWAGTA